MEKRSVETAKKVAEEMKEELKELRGRRNRVGNAMSTGGDILFVQQPSTRRKQPSRNTSKQSTRKQPTGKQPTRKQPTRKQPPHNPKNCQGCGKPAGDVHKCDICGSNMHPFCGHGIGDEGFGQKIRCKFCDK